MLATLLALAVPQTLRAQTITRSITLGWTAPGDDGASGTASAYSVRYSTSPLTEPTWASASVVSGAPSPLVAGTYQSFTASGFTPGTTYYFGLKTVDEAGNWSALGNVVSVAMPAVLPFITGVAPGSIAQGASTALTVSGIDFQGPDSLWLQRTGRPRLLGTSVSTPSALQILGTFSPAAADTGYWHLVVKNADGKADTLLNALYVRPATPSSLTVTSISPSSGVNTGSVTISNLAGTGFGSPAVAQLTRSGQTPVTATSVVTVSTTRITCSFDLTGLLPGRWDVYVRNPDGQSATLAGGFGVSGLTPAPTVNAILPASGYQGQTLSGVTIAGTGFQAPDTVYLSAGTLLFPATGMVTNTAGLITCSISLATLAPGTYSVLVRNPDGQVGTLAGGFTVLAPVSAPSVTSFNPSQAYRGQTIAGAVVNGSGFVAPDSVILSNGARRVVASNVEFLSSSQLRCVVDLSAAPTGVFDLKVKNPDGTSGTLAQALTVSDPPQGTAPTLISIQPVSARSGSTITITFLGTDFTDPPVIRLMRMGRFVLQPASVVLLSPTLAQAEFDLQGAPTGAWDAYLGNTAGLGSTLAGAFTVLSPPPSGLSLSPVWGARNTVIALVARGTDFVGPNQVRLAAGAVQVGAVSAITVSAGEIDATLSLAEVPLGRYDLVVTNADGQADTLTQSFEVRRRRPVAQRLGTTVSRNTVEDLPLTVRGCALDEADTLYLALDATRILANRVEHDGDSVAVAHFDLRGAPVGEWTVVVANATGDSSCAPVPLMVQPPLSLAVLSITPASACAVDSVDVTVLADGAAAPESLWISRGAARRYAAGTALGADAGHWRVTARLGLAGAAAGDWDVTLKDVTGQTATAGAPFRVNQPVFGALAAPTRHRLTRGTAATDTVRVVNTGSCPVSLSFRSGSTLMSVTPAGATLEPGASELLNLRFVASNRPRGSYPAVLSLVPSDTALASVSVAETLQVLEPRMLVAPAGLSMRILAGHAAPSGSLVSIVNAGDAPLHFRSVARLPWAALAPLAGTVDPGASYDATVTWSGPTLAAGTYHGNLSLTSDDSSQDVSNVGLTLYVDDLPPGAPYLVSDSTGFHIALRDANSATRRLGLYNQGASGATFSARHHAGWLSVAPDTGIVLVGQWYQLNLVVGATSLVAGTYDDTIEVRWGSDVSRWLSVPVRLDVSRSEVNPLLCPGSVQAAWSGTSASVTWDPSSDARVARYRVYRRPDGGIWAPAGEVGVSAGAFSDPGLDSATAYVFRVDPVDAQGVENQGCTEVRLAPRSGSAQGVTQAAVRSYPNPFGSHLNVRLDVPAGAASPRVRVTVFDAAHRTVAVLMDAGSSPGRHVLAWDGRNGEGTLVAPGVYRVQLEIDGNVVRSEWVAPEVDAVSPQLRRGFATLCLCAALGARGAAAQQSGGANALPFFLEPLDGARAALGGAQPARGGDAAALFTNPAGLSGLAREAFVAHTELDQGLRLESAAVSLPLGRSGGTLSLGLAYAHLGSLEGRDENGDATGTTVSYGASLLRAAYALNLGPTVSVGLALEHLYQGIDGEGGSGFAAGLGALVRTPAVDLAVVADHLGPDLKSGEASTPAPRTLRGGVRVHAVPGFDFLAEISRCGDARATGASGLEYHPTPAMALRAGYHRELGGASPLSGFSAGVGTGMGRWNADYAVVLDQGQGAVHRLSLRLGLGLPRLVP